MTTKWNLSSRTETPTSELITRSPFSRIERELNAILLNLKKQQKIDESTYFKLRSSDGIPPAIRGSIKHHKVGHPLRTIVTCIGSALYNTSKFLTNILAPIQNRNGFSVPNSQKFSNEIADINILDDETMVSFDVVSLFTAIPVEKARSYIRKKLEDDSSLHSRTNLDIDDIISLLNFVLSNNYFIYNDNIYKQIHGYAIGRKSCQPRSSQLMYGGNWRNSNRFNPCPAERLETLSRRQFFCH